MQTTVGIVMCLTVIIIFAISYMNTSEGITTATPTTTATIATSPTGAIPLSIVIKNAEDAATSKETIIALSQNKSEYVEHINHLLDYYDNRTIYEIINSKQDKNGEYNLSKITEYKMIKDTLIQSLEYINGY